MCQKQNILLTKNNRNKWTCNCHPNNPCPFDGKYLSLSIYSAEILIGNSQQREKYFGICETEFKTSLGNHKNSFKNTKRKDTELSKYIWDLKDKNITNYSIKWSIVQQTSCDNNVTNSCNLCLSEKLVISNFRYKNHLIIKLMDLVSKCRYKNKFVFSNYKS